ncbi:MAG: hypothetical protein K9L98_00710 [Candidatus Pacebacteria bacterium]|nr:hypothetical protein [Candidatus Paceibacterota bacterium]MCF7862520.1 hypothetical protein [Candidatus Paceibacterota bacterium]
MMNNVWITWGDVFNASLQNLWWGFIQFAPKLVLAIVLFVIGWFLGNLVARAFEHVFSSLKIDNLFQKVGLEGVLKRAGMRLNTGYFIGQIVKWFVIVVFLLPSLNLVGLDYIASFLRFDVLEFLPRVIVSAFILIIAAFVADFASGAVSASAKAVNVTASRALSSITRYAVWIFALIIALGHLGVADAYMSILFTGIVGMLSLGGALAFGLGGKEHASRLLSKIGEEMSER